MTIDAYLDEYVKTFYNDLLKRAKADLNKMSVWILDKQIEINALPLELPAQSCCTTTVFYINYGEKTCCSQQLKLPYNKEGD